MNTFKSLFMAFCAAAILSSCSGENKTADNDNTAEEATDSTVGGNLTADTTTSMMEADTTGGMMMGGPGGKSAQATISSASGSGLTGVATFTQEGGGVKLVLTVEKATPGPHAVHLHQNGDCSKPDATSAGPHWNPTKQEHGNREAGAHHQGDMPNMEVGQDGKGRLELTVSDWTIGGTDTTTNIINKAIIVHAKADDYKSQPAGNAGDRIGCGVVTLK